MFLSMSPSTEDNIYDWRFFLSKELKHSYNHKLRRMFAICNLYIFCFQSAFSISMIKNNAIWSGFFSQGVNLVPTYLEHFFRIALKPKMHFENSNNDFEFRDSFLSCVQKTE